MRNSVSWNARTIKPVPAWISGSSLIKSRNGSVLMYIDGLSEDQLRAAVRTIPGRVFYSARGKKYLTISDTDAGDPLEDIFAVLDALRAAPGDRTAS